MEINKDDVYIAVFSGNKFYPFNPKTEDICVVDIAHSLANQCRYSGHTKRYYSVAEHSLLVSQQLDYDDTLAKWGLLHDAAEAYITDVPRPIKQLFPEVNKTEGRILEVVAEKYNLPWPIPKEVHHIDQRMIYNEAPALMKMPLEEMIAFPGTQYDLEKEISLLKMDNLHISGWSPPAAKMYFLHRFDELWFGEDV